MKKPLLKVESVKKSFSRKNALFQKSTPFEAVKGVSFELYEGEILGLVGESGCGKSTLAHCIMGLTDPDEGEISFEEHSFQKLRTRALKKHRLSMQMVFQDPLSSLNPRKTILENLGDALSYHGILSCVEDKIYRVQKILKEIGMNPDVIGHYPHQFSGGQQQRLSIGRALALSPKLLICDEAVSALDLSVQAQILNLLSQLQKKRSLSYLFISHDLSVVSHLCDRVLVMQNGLIVERGETQSLFQNPKHPYTQKLLSSIPKMNVDQL